MTTKGLTVWTLRAVVPVLLAGAPVMAWVHQHTQQARFAQDVVTAGADDELVAATPQDLGLVAEPAAAVAQQESAQAVLAEPLVEEPLIADAGETQVDPLLEEELLLEETVVEEPALEEGEVLLADASAASAGGAFADSVVTAQPADINGGGLEYLFETPSGLLLTGGIVTGGIVGGYYLSEEFDDDDERVRDRVMSP